MNPIKITKKVVDVAKPSTAGKRVYFWESAISGLGLKILPTSEVIRFPTPHPRRSNPADDIRETRRHHTRQSLALSGRAWAHTSPQGLGPLSDKRTARTALTVDLLINSYLRSNRYSQKAVTTRAVDRGRLTRHVAPLLGKRVDGTLKARDIEKAFAAIRDGKTAARINTRKRGLNCVRGGEGTAPTAIKLLRAIYGWAQQNGLLDENPCTGTKLGADGVRETIIEDHADYARLF